MRGNTMHTQYLTAWTQWIQANGGSENTITTRLYGIRALMNHRGNPDPVTFTTAQIVAWLADCHNDWTRRTYLITARQWHRWLLEQGLRADDPTGLLRSPRTPRAVPRPAPGDAIHAVLTGAPRRVRAYIVLGLYAGLRCCEIARVTGQDFDGDRFYVVGKGGSGEWMPVHPLVAQLTRGYPTYGWWFPGRDHGHVAAKAVSRTIAAAFTRAGYHVTAHQLRHWFGTETLRQSGDLRVVQELMRHRSVASTQIYTQVESRAKTSAVRRLSA